MNMNHRIFLCFLLIFQRQMSIALPTSKPARFSPGRPTRRCMAPLFADLKCTFLVPILHRYARCCPVQTPSHLWRSNIAIVTCGNWAMVVPPFLVRNTYNDTAIIPVVLGVTSPNGYINPTYDRAASKQLGPIEHSIEWTGSELAALI